MQSIQGQQDGMGKQDTSIVNIYAAYPNSCLFGSGRIQSAKFHLETEKVSDLVIEAPFKFKVAMISLR